MKKEAVNSPGSAGEPALCSTCYKPIDPRASKCTECDSFQDWRRYLSISSSVLALLVALVSVVALAAPAFKELTTPKTAHLELSQQGALNNQLYVLATNSGIRPGSITSVFMGFSDSFDKSKNTDTDLINLPIEPLLVLPGQAKQLLIPISTVARQEIDKRYWHLVDPPGKEYLDRIYLVVHYRNFDDKTDGARLNFSLGNAFAAGSTPWHKCAIQHDSKSEIKKSCGEGPQYLDQPFLRRPLDEI